MANVCVGRPRNLLRPRIAGHERLQRLERDDRCAGIDELLVGADMIRVVLRVDDVLDRQGRDRPDLFHQPVEVLVAGILRVDDDQAFGGDTDERVRAAAGHHVEVRLQLPDLLDRLPCAAASAAALPRRRLCRRAARPRGARSPNDSRRKLYDMTLQILPRKRVEFTRRFFNVSERAGPISLEIRRVAPGYDPSLSRLYNEPRVQQSGDRRA